ncbi:MAG: DUF421 domain-containing protein [Planctomycetes bacterium]|nr:DUF421 domain-containing protein [Planctomycetota bacterium]
MDYLAVVAKLLVGSIFLVLYARLGGRSQVNPLSGTEVVSGMVVGAMISGSLFDNSVPVWAVAGVIVLWTVLFILMRYYKRKSLSCEKLIDGKSACLMLDGKLQPDSFNSLNLTLTDFETLIHQAGLHSIGQIREAWQETNGQLTVRTHGDPPLSVLLVERGRVHKDGLERVGRDEVWLRTELERKGVVLEDVFCAEWFDGEVHVY